MFWPSLPNLLQQDVRVNFGKGSKVCGEETLVVQMLSRLMLHDRALGTNVNC